MWQGIRGTTSDPYADSGPLLGHAAFDRRILHSCSDPRRHCRRPAPLLGARTRQWPSPPSTAPNGASVGSTTEASAKAPSSTTTSAPRPSSATVKMCGVHLGALGEPSDSALCVAHLTQVHLARSRVAAFAAEHRTEQGHACRQKRPRHFEVVRTEGKAAVQVHDSRHLGRRVGVRRQREPRLEPQTIREVAHLAHSLGWRLERIERLRRRAFAHEFSLEPLETLKIRLPHRLALRPRGRRRIRRPLAFAPCRQHRNQDGAPNPNPNIDLQSAPHFAPGI